MKDWKFKYMNSLQIAEVDKLINEGHGDALLAYGLECGNAGVKGYKRGCVLSVLLGIGLGAACYAVKKIGNEIIQRQVDQKMKEKKAEENCMEPIV